MHPNVTTEIGLAGVLAIILAAIFCTYPISILLALTGAISSSDSGPISRANRIAQQQMLPSFLAWVVSAAVSHALLFAYILVLGVPIMLGLAESRPEYSITDDLVPVFFLVSILFQASAYIYAIRATEPD